MNPLDIIARYYDPASEAGSRLIRHSAAVAEKALGIAKNLSCLNPDSGFIEEATLFCTTSAFFIPGPIGHRMRGSIPLCMPWISGPGAYGRSGISPPAWYANAMWGPG
ncbi:MAG: hypothetical protein R2861_06180 [Desulfobacterales bacterium]